MNLDDYPLPLELSPDDLARYVKVCNNPPNEARNFDTTVPSYGHRTIPLYRIAFVRLLLEFEFTVKRITEILPIGEEAARDIRDGRVGEKGRLPPELEVGERYVTPQRCANGHLVRILPCRTCRERALTLCQDSSRTPR